MFDALARCRIIVPSWVMTVVSYIVIALPLVVLFLLAGAIS